LRSFSFSGHPGPPPVRRSCLRFDKHVLCRLPFFSIAFSLLVVLLVCAPPFPHALLGLVTILPTVGHFSFLDFCFVDVYDGMPAFCNKDEEPTYAKEPLSPSFRLSSLLSYPRVMGCTMTNRQLPLPPPACLTRRVMSKWILSGPFFPAASLPIVFPSP